MKLVRGPLFKISARRKPDQRKPARPLRPPPRLARYSGAPIWRAVNRSAAVLLIVLFCFVYGFAYSLFAPALLPLFAVPIVVLVLFVVWALPDAKRPPVRPLEWLFFAFFASLALWPDYLAISLPGLPWITLLRLTGFPMVFLLLICLSTSAQFRKDLGQGLAGVSPIAILIVAFAVLQLLSIALSADKGLSIQKFFVAQTNWTAVFFISAYLFQKPGRLEWWVKVLWATAVVVSLIAIWEFRLGRVPWAGHIPSFLKIEDESVAKILSGQMRAFTNRYRTQATFSTSLGLAEYLALAMPFVLQLAAGRGRAWLRLAAAASVPLIFYAVVLTDARLGMIGCLLSFLLYGLVVAGRLWTRNKASILGPAMTLAYPVLFCGALAATFVVPRLHVAVWGGGAARASTDARIAQYNLGIPKILHNPLGYGIGMGAQTLGFAPFGDLTIDTYYISIALEYGVVGFIIYYSMIGLAIFHSGRRVFETRPAAPEPNPLFAPLAIALTNFLVIKSVFSQQDNHPLVYMILGAVVALCSQPALAKVRGRRLQAAIPALGGEQPLPARRTAGPA